MGFYTGFLHAFLEFPAQKGLPTPWPDMAELITLPTDLPHWHKGTAGSPSEPGDLIQPLPWDLSCGAMPQNTSPTLNQVEHLEDMAKPSHQDAVGVSTLNRNAIAKAHFVCTCKRVFYNCVKCGHTLYSKNFPCPSATRLRGTPCGILCQNSRPEEETRIGGECRKCKTSWNWKWVVCCAGSK